MIDIVASEVTTLDPDTLALKDYQERFSRAMNYLNQHTEELEKINLTQLIEGTVSGLHNEWLVKRRKGTDDGGNPMYEPRWKPTKDYKFNTDPLKKDLHRTIEADGGAERSNIHQANIATDFGNLPKDHQYENRVAFKVAIDFIMDTVTHKKSINNSLLEDGGIEINTQWLSRHRQPEGSELAGGYKTLKQSERNKDVVQVVFAAEKLVKVIEGGISGGKK
jgi:hypothetical protein